MYPRTRSERGVISRKDSAGSSRRVALPSKPVARNLVAIDCSRYKTVIQFSLPNFRFGSRPAKTHRATIGQHAPFIWMHTLTSERMWYPQSGHMNVVQPSASATLTNLITSQLSSLTFNCRSYGRGCVLVDNRVP
jgi:hypothetical protein